MKNYWLDFIFFGVCLSMWLCFLFYLKTDQRTDQPSELHSKMNTHMFYLITLNWKWQPAPEYEASDFMNLERLWPQ